MKTPLSSWLPTSSVCLSSSCSRFMVPLLETFSWLSTPQLVHSLPSIHTSCIANTYRVRTETRFSFLGDSKPVLAGLLSFPTFDRFLPGLLHLDSVLLWTHPMTGYSTWTEHPWGSLVPALTQLQTVDSRMAPDSGLSLLLLRLLRYTLVGSLRAKTLEESLPDFKVWLLYYQTNLVESDFPHLSKWE